MVGGGGGGKGGVDQMLRRRGYEILRVAKGGVKKKLSLP